MNICDVCRRVLSCSILSYFGLTMCNEHIFTFNSHATLISGHQLHIVMLVQHYQKTTFLIYKVLLKGIINMML